MDKPKRPMSAYMLWLSNAKYAIMAEHPNLKVTELAKVGGEMWKSMEDKSEWQERAYHAKEQYEREMRLYVANMKWDTCYIKKNNEDVDDSENDEESE